MDNKLHMLAALACKAVYKDHTNIGSTEFAVTEVEHEGEIIQRLAFAGSNDGWDWMWNLLPVWKDGVKFGCYLSVERAAKRFKPDPNKKLMVQGHSKAAGAALYWKKKYGADYCVAFSPAPSFREKFKLENTTLVVDPDDIVPGLGDSLFFNPDVDEVVTLLKDKAWYQFIKRIGDHGMDHIIEFLKASE